MSSRQRPAGGWRRKRLRRRRRRRRRSLELLAPAGRPVAGRRRCKLGPRAAAVPRRNSNCTHTRGAVRLVLVFFGLGESELCLAKACALNKWQRRMTAHFCDAPMLQWSRRAGQAFGWRARNSRFQAGLWSVCASEFHWTLGAACASATVCTSSSLQRQRRPHEHTLYVRSLLRLFSLSLARAQPQFGAARRHLCAPRRARAKEFCNRRLERSG